LYDIDKSLKELITTSLIFGKLPERLFPDKCKTCNLDNNHRQTGMPPVIFLVVKYDDDIPGRIVCRQDDAHTNPSKASVSNSLFRHMLEGIDPRKQLLTAETVTRLDEKNSCSGSSPVN
jgi:hypothetical protein